MDGRWSRRVQFCSRLEPDECQNENNSVPAKRAAPLTLHHVRTGFAHTMKLRIHHETRYSYTRRVRFGPHRLVLRPREGHDLRVESMDVQVSPNAELTWTRDVFGNSIGTLDFAAPAKELRIVSDVVVTRTPPYQHRKHDTEPTPFPPVYDALEIAVVAAYQQLSYPSDGAAVNGWVRKHCPKRPNDVEYVARCLNRAVHDHIRYVRREEKGVLTPEQTITRGVGSCRDFATLLLDAARSLGIAARFASGYLECSAAEAGYASTHAWVEIYLPGHGWRGYDPTLGTETSSAHVPTGLSNHPRGVMPVTGSYYGSSSAFRELTVAVKLTAEPETMSSAPSNGTAAPLTPRRKSARGSRAS
jgi:transglutaminase-like putative cysteine protease